MITHCTNYRRKIVLAFVLLLIISIVLLYNRPSELDERLCICWHILCLQLSIFICIWMLYFCKNKFDLLDPFVLVTGIHVMLFEITPLFCLIKGDISWYGIDVWDGCIKGTWISTLGYVCLFISYFFYQPKLKKKTPQVVVKSNKKMTFNLIIWVCSFLCNAVLILNSGKNLLYILTMGRNAITHGESTGYQIGFLGMLSYMMLPSFYYVLEYGKSRILKFLLFYLTFASLFVRGFRFIMLALIMGPVLLFCLKKEFRPKVYQVVLLLVLLCIMFGFVEAVRNNVRAGQGYISAGQHLLSMDNIMTAVIGNFAIFKTYYGVVNNIPENLWFTMGIQMFAYTAILVIPRAIWKGKPQPVIKKVATVAVTEYANYAGTAYPYIGEYYHEFGISGVAFFSFILGAALKWLKECMNSGNIHVRIIYVTVYPLILQILIRGYTPSNFWMIVIMLIPVLLNKYIKL